MTTPLGTIWPSHRQRLLLTTALGEPAPAADAWQALRPQISIDELELGSYQLLPLVYRNLGLAGYDDEDLQRLKGIYRRTWVTNQLSIERTKSVSQHLEENEIRAEFVEGVVLASRFYSELGLRPSSVLDVLVDIREGVRARSVLTYAGWSERRDLAPGDAGVRYLFDKDRNQIALRTRLAPDLAGPAAPTYLWEPGESHSLGDLEVRVPPPTETLFAVCAAHARVEGAPNLQWIVDAKMVMGADVDWQRLLELGRVSTQVARLRDVLAFFGSLPGPTPPAEIHDLVAAIPVSRRQRISYRCTVGAARLPGGLARIVGEHLAATSDRSALGSVAAFPRFLRDRWHLTRTWQVPFDAGRRVARLLAQRGRAT